jgi:hypothetical protein
VEDEALVTVEPGADLQGVMGDVVVEDDVDDLAGRHFGLDSIQESDELLMAVTLNIAADDGAIKDIERGEQGGGAVRL